MHVYSFSALHTEIASQDCAAVKMYLYDECLCMQTLLPRIVQLFRCIYIYITSLHCMHDSATQDCAAVLMYILCITIKLL